MSSSWDLLIYFLDLFDYSASWGGSQEICMILLKSKWPGIDIHVRWIESGANAPLGPEVNYNWMMYCFPDVLFILPYRNSHKSGLSLSWPGATSEDKSWRKQSAKHAPSTFFLELIWLKKNISIVSTPCSSFRVFIVKLMVFIVFLYFSFENPLILFF